MTTHRCLDQYTESAASVLSMLWADTQCENSPHLLYAHEKEIYFPYFKENEYFTHSDSKNREFNIYIKHPEKESIEELSYSCENDLDVQSKMFVTEGYVHITFADLQFRLDKK